MATPGIDPTFFLIGAPKCGTTAVASYLREHPQIFLTDPKEPFYLADELRPMARQWGLHTDTDYQALYRFADRRTVRAAGEASTLYLWSPTALGRIRTQYADARMIALVRNPIDVAHAFHMQMVYAGFETVSDFELAWRLQSERRQGRHIPASCPVPELLLYGDIARLGSQLQRVLEQTPREQCLFLLFDDLKLDTGALYRRIVRFLGLDQDQRVTFPKSNEAMIARSRAAISIMKTPLISRTSIALKRALPHRALEPLRRFKHWMMRRPAARAPLSTLFRHELQEHFAEEINLISQIVQRDLDAWRRPPSADHAALSMASAST